MIEALIFDVGGVLIRTQSWEPRRAWDKRLGLAPGTVEETVFNSAQGKAAQRGELSAETHWSQLATQWTLSDADLTQLRADFWAGDRLDTDLVQFICRQKETRRTAIISNAMDDLRHDLTFKWGIADAFELIVVSAEFGTMKPDPSIYLHTLHQLHVEPGNAVFIDDFAHNVVAARDVGMHGIQFTPDTDLYAELAALGVT